MERKFPSKRRIRNQRKKKEQLQMRKKGNGFLAQKYYKNCRKNKNLLPRANGARLPQSASRIRTRTKDLSFPSTSSASQGDHESRSSRKLKVTVLSIGWQSKEGGFSSIIRELAIHLAKHPVVEVSMFLPECSEEDVRIAEGYHVKIVKANQLAGYHRINWLLSPPKSHEADCVIGHGLLLGRPVQIIQNQLQCKFLQVVHAASEDIGRLEEYAEIISTVPNKREEEVKLCELADQVVAIGPKLADEYSCELRPCRKDNSVFILTPSIFPELSKVKQAVDERRSFRVVIFGYSDTEDLKFNGYDIAAKAFSRLTERYELVFVGARPGKEKEVEEELREHGINHRLTVQSIEESRKDLARLFCKADLCIMPSRTDGFALPALEALSTGLPILVSEHSGLADVLQEVPNGSSCVVHTGDFRGWANAIRHVREKERNIRLQEAKDLRRHYAEKYCWKKQCDDLVEKIKFHCNFGTHHATEEKQDTGKKLTRKGKTRKLTRKRKIPLNRSAPPPSKKQRLDEDMSRFEAPCLVF